MNVRSERLKFNEGSERSVKVFEQFFQLSGDSDMVQKYSGTCLIRSNVFLETKMKQMEKQ